MKPHLFYYFLFYLEWRDGELLKTDGLRRTGTLMRSGPFFFLVSGMKCVVGEREKKKVTMPEEINGRRGVQSDHFKRLQKPWEKNGREERGERSQSDAK